MSLSKVKRGPAQMETGPLVSCPMALQAKVAEPGFALQAHRIYAHRLAQAPAPPAGRTVASGGPQAGPARPAAPRGRQLAGATQSG
jgi:hypothetical protein